MVFRFYHDIKKGIDSGIASKGGESTFDRKMEKIVSNDAQFFE